MHKHEICGIRRPRKEMKSIVSPAPRTLMLAH
jgi:hypothetical protein